MRKTPALFVVALAGALATGSALTAERMAEEIPTFSQDVARIIFENCASCHRPSDIAPMSLTSYEEVRPWARSIKDKVVSREMPPWHAVQPITPIRNERQLTQNQIDTIVAWVDGGAPLGDADAVPDLPEFSADEWHHPSGRPPDHILSLPVVMEIPAEGELPYFQLYSKIPFDEDVFASAVEMLPDNRSVVHHMSVNIVDLPYGITLRDGWPHDADGAPLTKEQIRAGTERDSNVLSGSSKLICFVPGRGFEMFQPGVAKRVRAGQYLQWNLHYNPIGQPETDHSRVGLWTADSPVTHEMLSRTIGSPLPTTPDKTLPVIVNGKEVGRREVPVIPPYADDWEIIMQTDVREPITLYAISPHMHLRGKDMRFMVVWPDGREELLLDVPRYDFNW